MKGNPATAGIDLAAMKADGTTKRSGRGLKRAERSSLGDNWVGTPGMTTMEHGAGRRLQLDYQVKPRSSDTMDVGLSVIGERATNNRWGGTSNGLRTEAQVSW
jgi:hypothetical protein